MSELERIRQQSTALQTQHASNDELICQLHERKQEVAAADERIRELEEELAGLRGRGRQTSTAENTSVPKTNYSPRTTSAEGEGALPQTSSPVHRFHHTFEDQRNEDSNTKLLVAEALLGSLTDQLKSQNGSHQPVATADATTQTATQLETTYLHKENMSKAAKRGHRAVGSLGLPFSQLKRSKGNADMKRTEWENIL